MALDPIVAGCDWQATIIADPTIGRDAAAVVEELTGAAVAVRLVAPGGVVVATGTGSITSATARTIEAVFTAAQTRNIAPGVGFILDVRVTTAGSLIRPVQVREKLEVRPFTVGAS